MGVNVGSNADAVRGTPIGSTQITGAVINLTGTEIAITGATKTSPIVITAAGHGFSNDDIVWITGATGMTQLNNKAYRVRNRSTNTFELYTVGGSRVNGNSYGTYSGNAKVRRCQNNDCSVTITSNSHGMINNQYVHITGVNGMTQINNQTFLVGNATANTFTIDPNLSALSPYTSGGQAWCAQQGCTWFAFENMYGDLQAHRISTCVTERTGADAYTDASPFSARVGRNYPGSSNPCLGATLQPLSSNKDTLRAAIDGYSVQGSTAGQIGIGWAGTWSRPTSTRCGPRMARPPTTPPRP